MSKSLYDSCIERDEFLLLVQWDKQRNGQLTVRDVMSDSQQKVWWQCEYHHHWEASVYSRSVAGTGCPSCASGNMRLSYEKSLASEHPGLLQEWHPTLNVGISPKDIQPGTHQKVWWVCQRGHEWKAQVNSRVSGAGCPVCANRKVQVGENDLATTHPELAAQWHPVKNDMKTPQAVVGGSCAKVWWVCSKGHEWQATIRSRTSTRAGCPVCAGKRVISGVNDLASVNPVIAAQWHPTKNGSLTPEQVAPYSSKRVWWLCEKGHEYNAVIGHRVHASSGCPYCSNLKVLAGFNDLATIYPAIAAQWHPELNGVFTPQMVTPGSHKRPWWICPKGHAWRARVLSRTGPQKTGCPVCAGRVREDRQLHYASNIEETLVVD